MKILALFPTNKKQYLPQSNNVEIVEVGNQTPADCAQQLRSKLAKHSLILIAPNFQNADFESAVVNSSHPANNVNQHFILEVARQLRQLYVNLPIIICAPNRREAIIQRDRYDILKTRSCEYLQLKLNKPLLLPDLLPPSLSQLYLEDINQYVLSRYGILNEQIHHLNTSLRNANAVSLNKVIQTFRAHLNQFGIQISNEELSELEADLRASSEPDKRPLLHQYMYRIAESNQMELPKMEERQDYKWTDWTILCIEDTDGDRKTLKAAFEAAKIKHIVVENAKKAFELLEANKQELLVPSDVKTKVKKIIMVMVDWRLLKEDDGWQEAQGYDILEQIVEKKYDILKLAILTDKLGVIIRNAQAMLPFPVHFFSKNRLQPNEQQAFMNELRFIGDEGYQQWLSLNMPIFQNATQNRYAFQEIYSDFLRQHDYNIVCQKIHRLAYMKYVQAIIMLQGIEPNELVQYIRSRCASDLRLQGIAIHFNKTQPPSAYFQVLYARLIGRLTYLAIRQQCANWVNSSTIALTVALNNPNIQNAENYRSTFLRLVAEPENGSMLYTEKLWLDNVRAPNIEDVMDFYNECIESREQNWGDFFTKLQNILLVRPLWQ